MHPDAAAPYVHQLTGCQNRLYAYIYSLIGNAESAWDVLQETNTVLWRKAEEYDPERPFLPWALRVALNQVRAARTRLGRDRLVFHEQKTLEALTSEWLGDAAGDAAGDAPSDLEIAMDGCLKRLPTRHRDVIERYYKHGESLRSIAETLSRTANAVGVMLHRIRRALAECIQRALDHKPAAESSSEG
jgi:RNA polymerase sigma-70 factor (ECF subfamily)